jgi:hypothetical protein
LLKHLLGILLEEDVDLVLQLDALDLRSLCGLVALERYLWWEFSLLEEVFKDKILGVVV